MSSNPIIDDKDHKNEEKDSNNLFVYGALRQGRRLNFLLKNIEFKKAILPGYKKLVSDDLGFNLIIKTPQSEVEGELYFDLTKTHFNKIDEREKEGIFYNRIIEEVETIDGKKYNAYVYYPTEKLLNFAFKKDKSKK